MSDVFIVPTDGSLEHAIDKVSSGGQILIKKGEYYLEDTILIDKPLRIMGEGFDATYIIGSAEPRLFDVKTSGRVFMEGISLIKKDSNVNNESSCLVSFDCDEASFIRCSINGDLKPKGSHELHGVIVRGQTLAKISECSVVHCSFGITTTDTAKVEISNNQINENNYGTCFMGRSSGNASANNCYGNIGCCFFSMENSSVEISGNYCESNGAGIVCSGEYMGLVSSNTCRGNEGPGILIQDTSAPQIVTNQCEGNGGSGILVSETSGGKIRQNNCRSNMMAGIEICDQACPEITNNSCCYNGVDGIASLDNSSGMIMDNLCSGNDEQAIFIADTANPIMKELPFVREMLN